MTFREAAKLAASAQPGEMWLTHYSPSMTDPEPYLAETRKVFPRTIAGHDGMKTTLKFQDE